jgi:hypothetical protein
MSTKDLINAIIAGDAIQIETSFNATMAEKISAQMDDMRAEVSASMFKVPEEVSEEIELTEEELDTQINEVISKDSEAGEWISDFVHSTDPKFDGKSKEKRKEMALAAYYAKQRA